MHRRHRDDRDRPGRDPEQTGSEDAAESSEDSSGDSFRLLSQSYSRRSFLAAGLTVVGAALLRVPVVQAAAPGASSNASLSGLDFASALDAARAIRRGAVSSVELTNRVLDRIERLNPKLNAMVTVTRKAALVRAGAADQARGRGESWGILHGVPCTVKDTLEMAGVRTTAGSPSLATYIPARDAVVVARLRAAGAVIVGKSNVPLMAGDWQSYNEIFGTTNNPWDVKRTPGGSTGGGAAAVAAGLGYLSVGSDIAGSIRVPAHFCGIYGHKPTVDVIPTRGHIPPLPRSLPMPPSSLFVAGVLARNANDLRAGLEVLGGPDSEEGKAYRWSLPPARRSRLSDYRIGYVQDDSACPVESEVRAVLVQSIAALRKAGVRADEGWPPGMHPASQYATYVYLFNLGLPDEQEAEPGDTNQSQGSLAGTTPYKRFLGAEGYRMVARSIWQKYFNTHDAFLLPTAFVPAFPHDHSENVEARRLNTSQGSRPYLDLLFWTSFATFAGLPATTAPVGFTAGGLPVGLQIMGPYLEDATPIDLAARLAKVIGGFKAPPGY